MAVELPDGGEHRVDTAGAAHHANLGDGGHVRVIALDPVHEPAEMAGACRQSRPVAEHQSRSSPSERAYASVVLSAQSRPSRTCSSHSSASGTGRYAESTTVQYRSPDGNRTWNGRNSRIPRPIRH